MVRSTPTVFFAILACTARSDEDSASLLQVMNKNELAKQHLSRRQRDSIDKQSVSSLSVLETSLQRKVEKRKGTPGGVQPDNQTCSCPFTSGNHESCCSHADGGGLNTGEFCGSMFNKNFSTYSCNSPENPVCCTSNAVASVCCPAGSMCSAGCLGGGATSRDKGLELGACACVLPPPASEALRLYDKNMASAMAELASSSYCTEDVGTEDLPKLFGRFNCEECSIAGFQLENGTVEVIIEEDFNSAGALFAYVARAKSLEAGSTVKDGDCILSIRGSANGPNWKRNFQTDFQDGGDESQVSMEDAAFCDGCGVHSGWFEALKILKPKVVNALNGMGCGAGSGKAVYATGHSFGASVATLFIYDLQMNGFNMGLSYVMESPRVGNKIFSEHFRAAFDRPVSMYRVSHLRDVVVHWPLRNANGKGGGYWHTGAEVYFPPSWNDGDDWVVCDEDDEESVRCANRYNVLDSLGRIYEDHVENPLPRIGHFTLEQDWCKGTKKECISWGGWRCD